MSAVILKAAINTTDNASIIFRIVDTAINIAEIWIFSVYIVILDTF